MPESPPLASPTLPSTILSNCARFDDQEFLRLVHPNRDDETWSYAGFVDAAKEWGGRLQAEGIGVQDRVVVSLPHGIDLYAAYVGAILIGAVPAMFSFPNEKFSKDQYFAGLDATLQAARPRAIVLFDDLAEIHREFGFEVPDDIALITPGDAGADKPAFSAAAEIDPDADAFVQYSSGTTGIKKGVAVSHRALLWQIDAYGRSIGIDPNDRIATWLPLYHDMGLIACLFLPLVTGTPIVAASPLDWVKRPRLWLQIVTEHRCTLSWLPNFAYNFMARSVRLEDVGDCDLSCLRGVVNCSEPVMAESHERFMDRFAPLGLDPSALAVSYAMAENTFAVTSGGFGTPPRVEEIDLEIWESEHRAVPVRNGGRGKRFVSCGAPLAETEVTIVDAEGKALPDGVAGEICLRSPCLMTGYLHDTAATVNSMTGGIFRTGDIGYLSGGELFVTGRKKDLIIIGGKNIYPQDIENIVSDVEGVIPGRVSAIGIADEASGTQTLIVLAESNLSGPDRDALEGKIYNAIATCTDVVPGDILLLEHMTLKKSSSGKMSRTRSHELYQQHRPDPGSNGDTGMTNDARAGDGDAASRVRQVVERILRDNNRKVQTTPTTPLISSGLIDSFAMVELISDLEKTFDVRIPTAALEDTDRFDSIAAIAATLGRLTKEDLSGNGGDTPETVPAGAPPMQYESGGAARRVSGFWTFFNLLRLRLKGIRVGAGFQSMGPLTLQVHGHPDNVTIGRNVTFMPGVHLKNREDGKLIIHDDVKLDTNVRLVVANQARLELGQNVALGMGTLINAGRDVLIGRGSLSGAYCVLNASDHGIVRDTPIQHQPYEHAPITLGEDVWLGAHVFVSRGAVVGAGAIVSAGSLVSGTVPGNTIIQGSPARVIKFRQPPKD